MTRGGPGAYSGGQYSAYYQAPPYNQYPPYQQYQYGPYSNRFDAREKDPGLALIFSLIFPGLGQWYNGDMNRAIALIAGFAFATIFVIGAFAISGDPAFDLLLLIVVGLFLTIVYIWQLFDAFNSAKRHNIGLNSRQGK
jgi:TM2 domain-containing membrane protein YozV